MRPNEDRRSGWSFNIRLIAVRSGIGRVQPQRRRESDMVAAGSIESLIPDETFE